MVLSIQTETVAIMLPLWSVLMRIFQHSFATLCTIVLLLSAIGCTTPNRRVQPAGDGGSIQSQPENATKKEFQQLQQAFQVDVGDVVDILVFGEPNLKGTFQVYPDCTILFPLIKRVKVCGRTPGQIRQEIAKRLNKDFLQEYPSVGVKVVEYNSKKIHVFGQVSKPGRFAYYPGLTIIQAIAMAGGFASKASRNDTRLIRKVRGVKRRFRIPLGNLNSQRVVDFTLRPGDIIFVPESWY